jgi:hypothetical protein
MFDGKRNCKRNKKISSMRRRIFIKQMTPAEVGDTKTHEKYIRLPNNFDYQAFFQQEGTINGSVIQIDFNAEYHGEQTDVMPLKFVYYESSNQEKRIPSLGPIFDKYKVTSSDVVCIESRTVNSRTSFLISFKKSSELRVFTSPIFYEIEEVEEDIKKQALNSSAPNQIIYYGAPGTGKSYSIDCIVNEDNSIRTTFHPDSDYSTFVGAYKPVMEKVKMSVVVGEGVRFAEGKEGHPGTEQKIVYKYNPQAFLKAYVNAWEKYNPENNEPYYLVIEEINRGNCAQIFGDIFQLLDRNNMGSSSYTIDADDDIRKFLATDEKGFARFSEEQKEIIKNFVLIKNSGREENIGERILNGTKLLLPPNLRIWATMNTSDQSLFPIDSAFKRRWDWKYSPIKYNNEDWLIEIDGRYYSWVSFQKEVNARIFDATKSEDKMLGDYFVNPYDGIITKDLLLNKILFYLWNDVCKDGEGDIFRISETEEISFSTLHNEEGQSKLIEMFDYLGLAEIDFSDETNLNKEGTDKRTNYSINGEGTFSMSSAARKIIQDYANNNPSISPEEMCKFWNEMRKDCMRLDWKKSPNDNVNFDRYIKIDWGNNNFAYVRIGWSGDVFKSFVSKLKEKGLDYEVEPIKK